MCAIKSVRRSTKHQLRQCFVLFKMNKRKKCSLLCTSLARERLNQENIIYKCMRRKICHCRKPIERTTKSISSCFEIWIYRDLFFWIDDCNYLFKMFMFIKCVYILVFLYLLFVFAACGFMWWIIMIYHNNELKFRWLQQQKNGMRIALFRRELSVFICIWQEAVCRFQCFILV